MTFRFRTNAPEYPQECGGASLCSTSNANKSSKRPPSGITSAGIDGCGQSVPPFGRSGFARTSVCAAPTRGNCFDTAYGAETFTQTCPGRPALAAPEIRLVDAARRLDHTAVIADHGHIALQSRVALAPVGQHLQSKICMTQPNSAMALNHAVVIPMGTSLHDKAVLPVSPARWWHHARLLRLRDRPGDARRFLGQAINPA